MPVALPGQQRSAEALPVCSVKPTGLPIRFGAMGMIRVCADMYIDAEVTPEEQTLTVRRYEAGMRHVAGVFAALASPVPVTFFCSSDACNSYFAGSTWVSRQLAPHDRAPGATYVAGDRPALIITRVGQGSENLLVHEMVHAEMRFRLRGRFVPIWFHEGVAASIGDAPTCPAGLAKGIDDLRKLDGDREWAEQTSRQDVSLETYCQARAEVEAWGAVDGKRRLQELVSAVARGVPFDVAYGPLKMP
jgi:hypothetical protein